MLSLARTRRCGLALFFINENALLKFSAFEPRSTEKTTSSVITRTRAAKKRTFTPSRADVTVVRSANTDAAPKAINKTSLRNSQRVGPIESFRKAVWVKLRRVFVAFVPSLFIPLTESLLTWIPVFSSLHGSAKEKAEWGEGGGENFIHVWAMGERETRKTRIRIYKSERFWLVSFNRFWKLSVKSAADEKKVKNKKINKK